MLEMCEWEIIWSRGSEESWSKARDYWEARLTEEGKSLGEIVEFLRRRNQVIHNHPVTRFVDAVNWLFWLILWKCKLFRYHHQDLNDRPGHRHLFHARGWFYLLPNIWENRLPSIGYELAIPTRSWHVRLDVGGGDDDFVFSIALGLFALYLKTDRIIPYKWLPAGQRSTGISIHDGYIWIDLWRDDSGWRDGGFHIVLRVVDWLIGQDEYSEGRRHEYSATIVLPEGEYPAKVELYTAYWTRPRWFTTKVRRAEITPLRPVPIPGKGENSWDCEENATYASTLPASTVEEAISKFTESTLKTRLKYGGEGWLPEAYLAASGKSED